VALAAAWAITGCGGGDDGLGAAAERLAQAVPPADGGARALAVTVNNLAPTVGDLFAWAQWKWPDLFPSAGVVEVDRDIGGEIFRIRAYATGIFLAVGTTNRGVFALLPIPGSSVISLGPIDNFTPEITAATCSFNPQAAGCTPAGGSGSVAVVGAGVPSGYAFVPTSTVPKAGAVPVIWAAQGGLQQLNVTMWASGGAYTGVSIVASPGTFGGPFFVNLNCNVGGAPQGCDFAALRISVDTTARTLTFDNSPIPTTAGTVVVSGTLRW
jgi:hypothetical protein